MARIRVRLTTNPQGIQAAAPSFVEVPGSYQGDPTVADNGGVLSGIPIGDPRLAGVTVMVDVPDEDVTGNQLDPQKVKARYPGHFLIQSGVIK